MVPSGHRCSHEGYADLIPDNLAFRRPSRRTFRGPLPRLAALAALALAACAGCAVPQPRGLGELRHLREPTTSRDYWLYLPKDYARQPEYASQRHPVVVTFHGMKPFDSARAQALEWEQEADRYGYIVVAPVLRTFRVLGQFPLRTVSGEFQSDVEATLAILNHVFQTTRADPRAVLSTSWSSGGYMAHYMLNHYPERFSALAVRQSNFSASVLDPDLVRRSRYTPILIINTQNDFGICKRESREAIEWYETHGYKNVFWIHIKNLGHERTPDLAADFFGRVAHVQPHTQPAVLAKRQAIEGNEAGIAFLSGNLAEFITPPRPAVASATGHQPAARRPAPVVPLGGTPRPAPPPVGTGTPAGTPPRTVEPAPSQRVPRNLLKVHVSSAIGIEPLHLGFSAECPPAWRRTADFRWTLDGVPIGRGISGQKTLVRPGEHALGVVVVTASGQEYRASRTIRVLPRLDKISSSSNPGGR